MPSYVLAARTAPRHIRPVTYTRGYHIANAILNVLFAISLTGVFAFLLGPVAYATGV